MYLSCGSLSIANAAEGLVIQYEGSLPDPTPVTHIYIYDFRLPSTPEIFF